MKNSMHLRFSAKSENELFARMAVSSFVAPLNPTIDEITEIKTIVSEAVTNSIIHGYKNDESCFVDIDVTLDGKDITIIIEDEGVGIKDIGLARQPLYTTKPEIERSGMGLTIIETFSDNLIIQSTRKKGTKLIVSKTLKDIKMVSYV